MAQKPLTAAEQEAILKAFGGGKTGFKQGANRSFEADRLSREKAGNSPTSVILSVEDVKGQYDASRALMTTLGGITRKIDAPELEAFRRNIETVRKAYKSGIKADQVLNLSLNDDLARARAEIHCWA